LIVDSLVIIDCRLLILAGPEFHQIINQQSPIDNESTFNNLQIIKSFYS